MFDQEKGFETVCYVALLLQKLINTIFSFIDMDTVWLQMHKSPIPVQRKKKTSERNANVLAVVGFERWMCSLPRSEI